MDRSSRPVTFRLRRAEQLIDTGLAEVSGGNHSQARDMFRRSADLWLTSEALTYWAWMEHQLGQTGYAMDLCAQAIAVDPEFGNPYNDLGSYLVAQGRVDEAIPWFEKAKVAKRYGPRQFPYMNMGRLFVARGQYMRALREFKAAAKHAPDLEMIQEAIRDIQERIVSPVPDFGQPAAQL